MKLPEQLSDATTICRSAARRAIDPRRRGHARVGVLLNTLLIERHDLLMKRSSIETALTRSIPWPTVTSRTVRTGGMLLTDAGSFRRVARRGR